MKEKKKERKEKEERDPRERKGKCLNQIRAGIQNSWDQTSAICIS